MSNPQQVKDRIQLVRRLSNELAAHLHSLPDDIWREPDVYASACEGWKIADVITHLILGANVFGLSITNALKGITDPPMGFSAGATSEQRMARLVDTRNAIHEDLFYDFNASCKRFNTLLLSLDEDAYTFPTWHPYFVISIERLIDIRASELAIHSWDIRYPMDRSAKLSNSAIPFMLDFIWRWLRTGFQKGDTLPAPIRYRFHLTDADAGNDGYDVTVHGDNFLLAPSDNSPADVTFGCDTNTYILFCFGRIPLRRWLRRGNITLDGDEKLAAQFTDWFKGV